MRGGVAPFGQVRLVVDKNDHRATRLVRIRASVLGLRARAKARVRTRW